MRNILFSCLNRSFRTPGLVWLSNLQRLDKKINFLENTEVWVFHTPDFDKSGFERFPWVKWQELPIINFANRYLPKTDVQGMMMRIQAFDWFHANGFQRVFYVDADTLMLKDFRDIYKTNLTPGAPLAACEDYVFTDDPLLGRLYEKVSYEFVRRMVINRKYFNSGVLYVDLPLLYAKLKPINEVSLVEYFIQNARRYMFPDQDMLNELYPMYVRLPRMFNAYSDIVVARYMTATEAMSARYKISNSIIVHFLAKSKPWKVSPELDMMKAQAPIELYWEAMQPVIDLLDKNFVEAVHENIRQYRHVIDHYRLTEDFLDE